MKSWTTLSLSPQPVCNYSLLVVETSPYALPYLVLGPHPFPFSSWTVIICSVHGGKWLSMYVRMPYVRHDASAVPCSDPSFPWTSLDIASALKFQLTLCLCHLSTYSSLLSWLCRRGARAGSLLLTRDAVHPSF